MVLPSCLKTPPPWATCTTSQRTHPVRSAGPSTWRKALCRAHAAGGCRSSPMPFKTLRNVLALFPWTRTFFSNRCVCRPQGSLPRDTKIQVKGQQEDVKIPFNLICATLHVDWFHHLQALFVERLNLFLNRQKRDNQRAACVEQKPLNLHRTLFIRKIWVTLKIRLFILNNQKYHHKAHDSYIKKKVCEYWGTFSADLLQVLKSFVL